MCDDLLQELRNFCVKKELRNFWIMDHITRLLNSNKWMYTTILCIRFSKKSSYTLFSCFC
jgi:Leucine-rich repeat (LRR) protein